MPDLLLLATDTKTYFGAEAIAKEFGLRVKSTVDPKLAAEWLSLKDFDVVLVGAGFNIEVHQDLTLAAWKRRPLARYIVGDPDSEHAAMWQEFQLLGADYAGGADFEKKLREVLAQVRVSPNAGDGPTRILVVEDLDSPRDIICFYIESLGLGEVKGVSSAKEALQELEQDPSRFACVITDIRMPGVTGKELIESVRLHKKLQHLPIVVLTAYGTVDTLVDCLKAGASGFLVKPPKREDLVRELGRALRIIDARQSPRLATQQEADKLRELLLSKGFS
ncbi:MAG: response regulator [Oligoflexia bacterium]|nr:response regulator [Oligoflexia bacterium]